MNVGRLMRTIVLFLLPTSVARHLVFSRRYRIEKGARIGFSVVNVDALDMAPGSSIGHLNVVKGGFDVTLAEHAGIGHLNIILRTGRDGFEGSELTIGSWGKITAGHRIDLTRSITMGAYSTIAGHGCQLWTHGYVHQQADGARYRIDGAIRLEDNVNVGSGAIVSMGVTLGRGVTIGAGAVVSKSLLEPGLYVSGPLRQLPPPADPAERGLQQLPSQLGDIVYQKASVERPPPAD